MKKLLLSICILVFANISYGQNQSVPDSSNQGFNVDLGVASRNIWRGLDYGSSPSIWGDLYGSFKNFSIGAMGTSTLSGSKSGYGNWMELYASYTFKNLTFVVDDYFFFNSEDSLNNYFDYTPQNTQHLVEARIEYENDYLDVMVGYVVYSNNADNTNGVYLEATYKPNKTLSFTAGYLTASQWLSFYDKGGLINLGINGHRNISVFKRKLPLTASLILNPNYQNASPEVGNNPVYFVLKTDF